MKNKFSFRRTVSVTFAAIGLAVLVVSCKKDLDQGASIPAAGVLVHNLAPDQNGVGVALNGSLLSATPLAYTNFSGNYRNVYAGQREVAVFDYFKDSVLAKSSFNFEDGKLYSLFVTGNKGVYSTLVVQDEVDSTASSEKAYVRFVNAVPDSGTSKVTIAGASTNIMDENARFKSVSDFAAVDPGNVTVSINNGTNINATRTIQLQKGWVYTALVIGDPAATDSSKKVQIRYIQNGIVPTGVNK
jgi:hypothetical protein